MVAYDLSAISFLWFGNSSYFPPDISIISELSYAILQFNSRFTKNFLNTVELPLFCCQRKKLQPYCQFAIAPLSFDRKFCLHFSHSQQFVVIPLVEILLSLMWWYCCFLNLVDANLKHQVVLITKFLVNAHKTLKARKKTCPLFIIFSCSCAITGTTS